MKKPFEAPVLARQATLAEVTLTPCVNSCPPL